MKSIYILTGAPGVGKSTISENIAKLKDKSALIEGDVIYSQVIGGYEKPWKEGNHLEVFWKICFDTIENYLKYDYDVIFNYIITPNILEQIKKRFSKYSIKFVLLTTNEETIIKRDQSRTKDYQMKERCILLLNNFKNYGFDTKYILDTSNLTIEETVKLIENEDRFFLN